MKQNRDPRNEPILIWAISSLQTKQEQPMGGKGASSISGVGKDGQLHAKNQTGLLSHNI